MHLLKIMSVAVVLMVVLGESLAFFNLPKAANENKVVLKKSIDFLQLAKKRSEESAKSEGGLMCFRCRNTDPNSKSCSGSLVTCQPGEVCASVFHSDNTNMDGCLAATICDHLSKSEGIYAHCCSTSLCNM